MNRRVTSIESLILLALLSSGAHAVDDLEWSEPVRIELPAPTRQISIKPGADLATLVERYQLESAQQLSLGQAGTVLEINATDQQWAGLEQSLCNDAAVTACDTATCQSIQFEAEVDPGPRGDSGAIRGRIVRSTPEALLTLPGEADIETDAAAGQCRVEPLADLLDEPATPGLNQDLMLDLDLVEQAGSRGRTRSYEVDLAKQFNATGGADISGQNLPSDSSDYQLELAASCGTVSVPLDCVKPAFIPGLIVALVDAGAAGQVATQNGLAVVREVTLDSTGESIAVFATPSDLPTALTGLARDNRVRLAQREYVYRTTAEAAEAETTATGAPVRYSDPFARFTYGPDRTGARLLQAGVTGELPLIAVIDAGVDGVHPEFDARVTVQDSTGSPLTPSAHGTAVAGIIAAAANNGVGIYGAAPTARILALQACLPKQPNSLSARCRTSTLLKALDLAMAANARIINMSLAGPPDPLLERYLRLALQQDRLVIAGAGNGGPHAKPGYPAAIDGVLAVTAVDAADKHYAAANQGDYIDLAAPGVEILSPTPDGRYPPLSGTSMATAQVAGVAALLLQRDASLGARALRSALIGTAADLGAPGKDPIFGYGVVDGCAAAKQLQLSDRGGCPARPDEATDSSATGGDRAVGP
ncbi:MAG: S8 family serine peptidase [Pseudomonadota bacterium]